MGDLKPLTNRYLEYLPKGKNYLVLPSIESKLTKRRTPWVNTEGSGSENDQNCAHEPVLTRPLDEVDPGRTCTASKARYF
jgi:hypothetical protein